MLAQPRERGRWQSSWTAGHVAILRRDYGRRPIKELAAELGYSVRAVSAKARRLGLRRPPRPPVWDGRRQIFERLYGIVLTSDLAKRLKTSPNAIRVQARKLGYRAADTPRRNLVAAQTEIRRLRILLAVKHDLISLHAAATLLGISTDAARRASIIEATKGLEGLDDE